MLKNPKVLDVLVAYTDGIATSSSSKNIKVVTPFPQNSSRANYNDCYAYLLEECKRNKLKAGFTTTKDFLEGGKFKSYWIYSKKKWVKKDRLCTASNIFDKFSPINKLQMRRRKNLFINDSITPFNAPELYSLFFDKKKTFDELSSFAIPTVAIARNDHKSIGVAYEELIAIVSGHPNKEDFSKTLVVKDRFGAGGNNIYKIKLESMIYDIEKVMTFHDKKSFVLQPFTLFNKGHRDGKFSGYVDIRLIFKGSNLLQAYIRKPSVDDFKCNEHQGGSLEYIFKRDIPTRVLKVAGKIVEQIDSASSVYALDFIISNGGNVYLMEGNSGPGIDWNLLLKRNERYAKKLIREIVKELKLRVDIKSSDYNIADQFLGSLPILNA